jgi:hypothetical protein
MAPYLVTVGPKALTWPRSKAPGSGWKEVFNPNANPVVKKLVVRNIQVPDPRKPGAYVQCADLKNLVIARRLTPNPDFPRTMPRGGTGHGSIIEAIIG